MFANHVKHCDLHGKILVFWSHRMPIKAYYGCTHISSMTSSKINKNNNYLTLVCCHSPTLWGLNKKIKLFFSLFLCKRHEIYFCFRRFLCIHIVFLFFFFQTTFQAVTSRLDLDHLLEFCCCEKWQLIACNCPIIYELWLTFLSIITFTLV